MKINKIFFNTLASSAIFVAVLLFSFPAKAAVSQISNLQVESVGTNSATVTWQTDTPSDSQAKIALGTIELNSLDYTVYQDEDVVNHSITFTNLNDDTWYEFRVVSGNNEGTSQYVSGRFTTVAIPVQTITISNFVLGTPTQNC